MNIELKECARLAARITEAACQKNRRAGVIFACEGCPGLGSVASVESREEATVAVRQCSVHNCTSLVHARGMCWKHEKSELGINPQTGKPLELKPVKARAAKPARVKSAPADVAAPSLPPANPRPAEVTLCDMGLELDQLFKDKRREWLEDLSGATTTRSRAKLFLSMADALEGLVY